MASKTEGLGPIMHNASYPLELFSRLIGLNRYAIRNARRKGLKMRRVGNRVYVIGSDWAEFLAAQEPC